MSVLRRLLRQIVNARLGWRGAVALVVLVLCGGSLLHAQYGRPRAKGPHTGPRALVVLESLPAKKGATAPSTRYRIVPVTIFYQKQYYDAAIYKASPLPMALLPQTVYEVEQGGAAKGTIEIDSPAQTQLGWQADGSLTLPGTEAPHKATLGTKTEPEGSDTRPKLRRGGKANSPASTPAPEAAPVQTPAAQAPAQPATPNGTDAAQPTAMVPEDPNRPKLQRGKPTESAGEVAEAKAAAKAVQMRPSVPELVAVSDVETSDPHEYALQWPKKDIDRLSAAATQQAQTALAKYIGEHFPAAAPQKPASPKTPAHSAARPRAAQPAAASPSLPQLQDVEVHAFDLDFDNDPEIVLTARSTAKSADGTEHQVFVAYVTREEGGHDYHPLLTYITDDTRLDEFPRLRLIDAVDADGDGIAELLFRASSSVEAEQRAFRLYATGPDRLRIVFDSRGAQD